MKLIKHFYYPYYYIENFNGSIILIFFLDNTFYFEDEDDIFLKRLQFKSLKKGKKVIEESNNLNLLDKIKKIDDKLFIDNFFREFF
jgi:hypothetical protein